MSTILQLFPAELDVNGDAQNALVLAQRARWAGISAEVAPIAVGDDLPLSAPALVVIGSGVDATNEQVREALTRFRGLLSSWAEVGVPMLAVGTGLEALGEDGIALVPGKAVPLETRAVGDLLVDSEYGQLVGFENHARGFELREGVPALGTVLSGVGNGNAREGVRFGSIWGTHLHGPVLAKNPAFADALLSAAFPAQYSAKSPEVKWVDSIAAAARAVARASIKIG
ncbi:MAG TPA: cobyric acid synthase [Candidatus Lumbricidophila sp.]|nr:cobyric acid synthase [Candidatus Lumbricidophila sp.]